MKKITLLTIFLIIAGAGILFVQQNLENNETPVTGRRVETFSSQQAMEDYIKTSYSTGSETKKTVSKSSEENDVEKGSHRVSGTGSKTVVQVSGIDEPDSVKTEGKSLYYTGSYRDMVNTSEISLEEMAIEKNFSEKGELLLKEENLYIINDDSITAYNTSDGEKIWDEKFENRYRTARLRNGKILLVLTQSIDHSSPCPVKPYGDVTVSCNGIFRPGYTTNPDLTYTFLQIDPKTGDVEDEASFVGDYGSEFYISEDNIYFTYTGSRKRSEVMFEFFLERASIDQELKESLRNLKNYDLSEEAYNAEINYRVEEYFGGSEEKSEELRKQLKEYLVSEMRDNHWTTVVKLDKELEKGGEAEIPGEVSDRKSMYGQGKSLYLVSQQTPGYSVYSNRTNDLYTLNEEMDVESSEKSLVDGGRPETRFEDGYLFIENSENKGVDQMDLENFDEVRSYDSESEFIYPLKDFLLIIGREETENRHGNISISLMDRETGKTLEETVLDSRFTSVSYNDKAFQIDKASKKFFVPGGSKSYLVDYSEGLDVEKLNVSAERSFLLNETVVGIGGGKIKKFDYSGNELGVFEIPSREMERPVREKVIEN